MRIRTTLAALAVLMLSQHAPSAMAQTPNSASAPASAASSGSRENVGAMPGVSPTPAQAPSSSPKLVRHNPGRGTVTQPASGASMPTDKAGGK